MTLALHGVGIAPGIAFGRLRIIHRDRLEVPKYEVDAEQLENEIRRFLEAINTAQRQLHDVKRQIPLTTSSEVSAFIDTHLLMLEDAALVQEPVRLMQHLHVNAEWALKTQRDALERVFASMDDAYLRTRADDVDHVVGRVMRILLNHGPNPTELEEMAIRGYIVVADDLTPADTALLRHQGIMGFITEGGGPTSHTAILARSLQIPSVIGVNAAQSMLQDDDEVILDGRRGVIMVDPDAACREFYRELEDAEIQRRHQLAALKTSPAVTRDGIEVKLEANIELPLEFESALAVGADGVGLLRTEFIFLGRDSVPSESDHYREYLNAVRTVNGRPLTIRTLDLGADKSWMPELMPATGTNPALGLRAIRLCMRDKAMFRDQLKAIVRVSAHGPVRLLVPMVSNVQELRDVISMVDDIRDELRDAGEAFDPDMPIGAMIEVPAAAICADLVARQCDFLSIGTNDLIQYTLAIDRINEQVSYLYDPLHPAVLRLVASSIEAGKRYGKPVALCGEMAGDLNLVRLLLLLGLREFSVHPQSLPEVKEIIRGTRLSVLPDIAREMQHVTTRLEANALISRLNQFD